MDIIILAAGFGNRLKQLTQDNPKAMVSVSGRPLIGHDLAFIDFKKVNTIFVIVGYKSQVLENHLQNIAKIKIINNPDYKAGSILTIEKVLPYIKDGFLLMNADHIYPRTMFNKIIDNISDDRIIAMVDSDRKLEADDMKVKLKNDQCIQSISKKLSQYDVGYIGMTYVGRNILDNYKKAVTEVKNISKGTANVEAVLDFLCKDHRIHTLDLSNIGWYEVDTPEDLKKVEIFFQNKTE